MDSDSEQQKYYLDELFAQCQFALDAYTDVQRLSPFLKNKRKEYTDITKDSRDLFRHLHSLFTHVANISKLLFNRGIESNRTDRGVHN